MSDIINIIDGHAQLALKKAGFENEDVEMLAVQREKACRQSCKLNKGKTYLDENDKCTACGCNMQSKWRAIGAKCILGVW